MVPAKLTLLACKYKDVISTGDVEVIFQNPLLLGFYNTNYPNDRMFEFISESPSVIIVKEQ